MKRTIALLLAALMILSLAPELPARVSADNSDLTIDFGYKAIAQTPYAGLEIQAGKDNPETTITDPDYDKSAANKFRWVHVDNEGYEFKPNKETGIRPTEPKTAAYAVNMRVPEVFLLSHFHLDFGEHFKLMLKLGIYGGYRLDIHRFIEEPYSNYEQYQSTQDQFQDYDRRLTYGVEGGLGAGFMLSPFEFHLTVQGKWGWESFWDPDYLSKYYYRFGYPLDAGVTFGVYYQLTPRYGHTRAQLKKLARKMAAQQQMNQ